jgi:hypothetical protein
LGRRLIDTEQMGVDYRTSTRAVMLRLQLS